MQTIGNFQIGTKEALTVGAVSLLMNELVFPQFAEITSGSSLVWNIQGGVNLYYWKFGKKNKRWIKTPALGVLAADLFYMGYEKQQGFEFGTYVAHGVHAGGLATGLLLGYMIDKMM